MCEHKIVSLLSLPSLQIVPYGRDAGFPDDTMYHFYKAIRDDKMLSRVFYEKPIQDIEAFIDYMQKAVIFLVVTRENPAIVGAVWFTNCTDYRGNVGIWYRRELWGEYGRGLSIRIATYAFHTFGWSHIWGFTPWRAVVEHAKKTHFKHVATLPAFVRVGKKMRELHVICMENTVCPRLLASSEYSIV